MNYSVRSYACRKAEAVSLMNLLHTHHLQARTSSSKLLILTASLDNGVAEGHGPR